MLLLGLSGYTAMTLPLVFGIMIPLAWMLLDRKELGSWVPLGSLAVLLILSLAVRQQLIEGFRLYYNDFADTVLINTGWQIPQLRRLLEQENLCRGIFSLAVSLALVPAAGILGEKHPAAFGLCLMLVGLLATVLLGGVNGWVVLGFALAVLLVLPAKGSHRGFGLLMGAVLLTVVVFLLIIGSGRLPAWQENLQKQLHERFYETSSTTLPEGDLKNYTGKNTVTAPALTVTMEVPQPLYLRGFTGEIWQDGCWKSLPGEKLLENRQLLSWLNENNFSAGGQFSAAGENRGLTVSQVTVRITGACRKWRYVPFNLCMKNTGRIYDLTQGGIPSAGEEDTYTVLGTAADIRTVLEAIQQETDTDYRRAESAYREFVYNNYLQVSSDMKDALEEDWRRVQQESQGSAQSCAVQFLHECFPEEGESALSLPLENAAGTSYQYATVAVMTLRYFGIPARYAEGYVIREDAAQNAAGGAMTVDSSCARAWVEVYQDGLGWIPMELTPGLEETAYEAAQENSTSPIPEEEDQDEEPEETEELQPDTLTGTVTNFLQEHWRGMPVVLVLLLLICVVLHRKLVLKGRLSHFHASDPADAVGWIVADSVRILEKSGIVRENGSLLDMEPRLAGTFGADYGMEFRQAVELNQKALFSSCPLDESHRNQALTFRAKTIELFRTRNQFLRFWWRKWIRCLY